MAPLSVHRAGGGMTSTVPASLATLPSAVRIAALAATPPAATSAAGCPKRSRNIARPRMSRSVTTSTTLRWNAAQRSRTSPSASGAIFSASSRSAVLSPESEKSACLRPSIGRGSVKRSALPARASRLDLRAAGIAQPQELRGLVEGFADGVVDRGAEPNVFADAEHRDDLGVAAGSEEQAIRERRRVGEPHRERMRLQVIDRDQRLLGYERDRLGGGEPDDHAADQPGPGGGRDPVELGEAHAGCGHRLGDDQVERFDMGARGDLRHHPAEGGVCLDLREHHVGADDARPGVRPLHHCRRGLIAGRLDAEHEHRGLHLRRGTPGVLQLPIRVHRERGAGAYQMQQLKPSPHLSPERPLSGNGRPRCCNRIVSPRRAFAVIVVSTLGSAQRCAASTWRSIAR